MKLNNSFIQKHMEFYKPLPLWYRTRNFIDDESLRKYEAQQWKIFQKSNRYIEYIKGKLVYEVNIANKFINKYNMFVMVLKKISTSTNVSQYMFVYNTIMYLI